MPFDKSKEPPYTREMEDTLGNDCRAITPGAGDQVAPNGSYFKYVIAATDGDVTVVPFAGPDGTTHTITMAAGNVIPLRVRRVTASTATCIGAFD